MSRSLLAALVSSSLLGGCAFSLSGPDASRPRNRAPECDTSKSLVVLDGLMATAMGVATLALVNEPEPGIALLPLALGAVYLGGAVKGNSAVNKCRDAMNEYQGAETARDTLANMDDPYDDEPLPAPRPRTPAPVPATNVVPPAARPVNPYAGAAPYPQAPGQAPYPQAPTSQPPAQPPAQRPAPPPQQPAAAAPARAPDDDDWTDFWREVP
jgi:hypothetical protein